MKNIKKIIPIFLLFLLSCSKDDNSQPVVAKEYFPTKITNNASFSTISSEITTIKYDNKNRIMQFKYEFPNKTDTYDVTYNSDDLVSYILITKVASTGTTTKSMTFSYTNNILTQYTINVGSTVYLTTVYYNIYLYTYNFSASTSSIVLFQDSNNVKNFYFEGSPSAYLTYNDNKGIYSNNNNAIPLLIASTYGTESNLLFFNSLFFSKNEISTVITNGQSHNAVSLRDSNNNISKINFNSEITNETLFTSTIEYESREIN